MASVESSIRQDRALAAYCFEPTRTSTRKVPTLLLAGSKTASPQPSRQCADSGLLATGALVVLDGQEHNAMDTNREQFADVLVNFLVGTTDRRLGK